MNITLIGMPLAGKSTVGKILAEVLGYDFIDTDKIIEEMTGYKLQDILDEFGEHHFLAIEEQAVLSLESIDNTIISPGGSIIYSAKAMGWLKEISTVIFLDISFETIAHRVTGYPRRGIITMASTDIKSLFEERLPLYLKYADKTIHVDDNAKPVSVAGIIIEYVRKTRGPWTVDRGPTKPNR